MSSAALRLQISKDRRDNLLLVMASDAVRVEGKAGEARHKQARQIGYRQVRYQRFQGRREEVLEDEIHERRHVRRMKSIQAIELWLGAQVQANAEEGSPRDVPKVPAGGSVTFPVEEASAEITDGSPFLVHNVSIPVSEDVFVVCPNQPLITVFLS